MSRRFVIVGAGQAAAQAVASLRQEGFAGAITIIGEEPVAPYQRPPLSKKYLLGELSADRLALKPGAFYRSVDVDVRLATQAVSVNRSAHEVVLSDGARVSYEKLLLATGARPRQLPDLSAGVAGVHYLRTMADSDALARTLNAARRLAVIGGGYIGLEVAAVARQTGLGVEVIEAAPRLMARVAGPVISDFFAHLHAERGVAIRLNARLECVIIEDNHVVGIRLGDRSVIAADAVLIGIGAIPNVELAEKAGLAVDKGIVVDAFARTSDPLIFAAGDCTNHPSGFYRQRLRLESVQNAVEQAKTAAASMCGKNRPYLRIPWFWSDQYDVKFQAAGLIDGHDEVIMSDAPGGFAVAYKAGGKLIAVEAVNAPAAFMSARRDMEAHLQRSSIEEI